MKTTSWFVATTPVSNISLSWTGINAGRIGCSIEMRGGTERLIPGMGGDAKRGKVLFLP